jgi:replicative DNA helicase
VEVLNAEQALLGCIIKQGELIKEVVLKEDYFADTRHQLIFQAMKQIESKGEVIDIVSLTIYLEQFLSFTSTDYLADMSKSVPSVYNFKSYEDYIVKAYKLRKTKELIRKSEEIHSIKDLDKLQEILLSAKDTLEEKNLKSFNMIETLMEIQEDAERNRADINGMPTGYEDLDKLLDGWKEEDLNIIGARPSVGKTAFMLALVNNAAERGCYVDVFSLEMSAKLLLNRMICMIGRIDSMKLKNPYKRFSEKDWTRLSNAQGILSKYRDNIYISDSSSPTIQDIWSRVKQSKRDYPGKRHLVIIDYLTLIKGSGRRERHLEIGEISRSLKSMARELGVSVIVLAQLSRKVEQRQDKRPMLSDLRDSGEIEQDADTITFLHRDDYYDADSEVKNVIEIIVAKNRNGPLGKAELAFLKEYNAFLSLARMV